MFDNLDTRHADITYDHTHLITGDMNHTYSSYLTTGTDSIIGPAILLPVAPGDTIEMTTYAKFTDQGTYDNTIVSGFIGELAESLSNVSMLVESVTEATDILNNAFSAIGSYGGSNTDVPRAYLNYILFDEYFNYVRAGFDRIESASGFDELGGPAMAQTISNNGYIYIWVSNETENSEVWFDDLMVTHKKHPVVQVDDYYPFGLTLKSSTYERKKEMKWNLYNGKELQEDLDLGWYDYGARMYDAAIGRFMVQDRFSDKYYDFSPYQYAVNNPIKYIDVNGDSLWIKTGFRTLRYENGNLYNKKGKQVRKKLTEKGGSNGSFLGKVVKNLSAISDAETSGNTGTTVVDDLVASDNNFTIESASNNPRRKGANEFVSIDEDGEYAVARRSAGQGNPNMSGSGGTIYWNTSKTSEFNMVSVEGGGRDVNIMTNLAHELKHAHDSNFGLGDNRPVNGLKRSEWRASFYENQIRYVTGARLRASYRSKGKDINILMKRGIFKSIYVPPPN